MSKELTVKVNKVSRAIRMSIPAEVAGILGIVPGDSLSVKVRKGEMVVRKVLKDV